MQQRWRSWLFDVRYTLWFVPGVMSIASLALALVLLRLDQQVFNEHELHTWWLFSGGADGARGVLSTIAGSMISVVTTAFSITIVALQLGSSQFSPRILRGFTGDRGIQIVLGAFIGTFVYAIVVLRSIRGETESSEAFVPALSVSVAIVLAFATVAALIYFFHHSTRTIQASVLIHRTADDTLDLVHRRVHDDEWPDEVRGEAASSEDADIPVISGGEGYLTAVDLEPLRSMAGRYDLSVQIVAVIGRHYLSNSTVARIGGGKYPELDEAAQREVHEAVASAFDLELERTNENDVLLGFRQLSDIAIKALSPAINDPTTATICIDRLGEALLQARDCQSEQWELPGHEDRGVVRGTRIGFRKIVDECIPQIRHYAAGAGDITVLLHIVRNLGEVAHGANPDAFDILALEARSVVEESATSMVLEHDRLRIRDASAWAMDDSD